MKPFILHTALTCSPSPPTSAPPPSPVQSLSSSLCLGFVQLLDQLGLSGAASQLEASLGNYWAISEEEAAEAAEMKELHATVKVRI